MADFWPSIPIDMHGMAFYSDTIDESTSAAGVTVDGVLHKDGNVIIGNNLNIGVVEATEQVRFATGQSVTIEATTNIVFDIGGGANEAWFASTGLVMNNTNVHLGTGGIGNNGAQLTFVAGAGGLATFEGPATATSLYVPDDGAVGVTGNVRLVFDTTPGPSQVTLVDGIFMIGDAQGIFFEASGTTQGTEYIHSEADGRLAFESGTSIDFNVGETGVALFDSGGLNLVTGTGIDINSVPFIQYINTSTIVMGIGAALAGADDESVIIGDNAGAALTTGDDRMTVIGHNAALAWTSNRSVVIGYGASNGGTGGTLDVIIGPSAVGVGSFTGTRTTVVGAQCARDLTGSNDSCYYGYRAGDNVTNGLEEAIFGASAGSSLTTEDFNSYFGACAGDGATSHSGAYFGYKSGFTGPGNLSVCLGPYAGYYETAASALFIDNAQRANEADGRLKALIYGIFAAATADQSVTINGALNVREDSLMIGTAALGFNAAAEHFESGAAGYLDAHFTTEFRWYNSVPTLISQLESTGVQKWYMGTNTIQYVTPAGYPGIRFGKTGFAGADIRNQGHGTFILSSPSYTGALNLVARDLQYIIGSKHTLNLTAAAGYEIVVNYAGSDADFRVESDTDTHCLFLDASLDAGAGGILLGTNTQFAATYLLTVDGNVGINGANKLALGDEATYIHQRADSYLALVADGAIELGDQTSGNYMRTTATGLGAFGTCRWYETEWLGANAISVPPVNQATYVAHGIAGAWQFIDAQTKYVHGHLQMPKNWAVGTDMVLQVGWTSNTADPGDDSKQAVWQMEALPRQVDEDTTVAAEVTDTVTASASQQTNGMVISTITIPSANIDAEDVCIIVRLARLGADGADTLGDTAELQGICLRYLANELGPSA